MNSLIADNIVLFADSLLTALVLINLPYVKSRKQEIRLGVWLLLVLAVRFVPIYSSYSLATIMYGCFGNVSLATLAFLACLTYAELRNKTETYKISPLVFIVLAVLAVTLYLSTFGYIAEDIYSWGCQPRWMLLIYLLALIIFSATSRLFSILWTIAIFAFILKIQMSVNLWDYLFDPIMILISIIYLVFYAIWGRQTKRDFKHV